MPRILFEKPNPGYRSVRGQLIEDLQQNLKMADCDPGTVDGIFGNDTRKALIQWQRKNDIESSGKVDMATWKHLLRHPIPSIEQRALQLTATFEGHSFTKVAGNFDNAWLTWGIIGFTLRHGEIQKIINTVNDRHPELLQDSFGPLAQQLVTVINGNREQMADWSNAISIGNKRYKVSREWEEAFERLGSHKEVQDIQLEKVKQYFDIAERDASRFGLLSEAGYTLCFDIAVQNGGIDFRQEQQRIKRELEDNPPSDEQDIREIIANVVAENSIPRWIEDVRHRKLTIANGTGAVHGAKYQIKTWGIGEYNVDDPL